jgi:hypothetical protein
VTDGTLRDEKGNGAEKNEGSVYSEKMGVDKRLEDWIGGKADTAVYFLWYSR